MVRVLGSVVVRARLLPDLRTMVLGRQCQGKPVVAVFLQKVGLLVLGQILIRMDIQSG